MTAVAILNKIQAGKTALIKKDGEEMLLAIVLDKPLAAQTLVNDPDAFISKLRGSFKQACAPALGRSGRLGYRVLRGRAARHLWRRQESYNCGDSA